MIYLIRHAQSLANIGGKTTDSTSIPITEQGWQQAHALIEQFPRVEKIIVSPYLRTQQTAQPLLQKHGLTAEVWPIHEFTYLSGRKFANTTVAERKPFVDDYWNNADPHYCDGDDAESFAGFYQRTADAISRLEQWQQQHAEQNLLVFTHGRFLQMLKLLRLHAPPLSSQLMTDFLAFELEEHIWNTKVIEWGTPG